MFLKKTEANYLNKIHFSRNIFTWRFVWLERATTPPPWKMKTKELNCCSKNIYFTKTIKIVSKFNTSIVEILLTKIYLLREPSSNLSNSQPLLSLAIFTTTASHVMKIMLNYCSHLIHIHDHYITLGTFKGCLLSPLH